MTDFSFDPATSSDVQLVEQIREGSRTAVDELMRRHMHAMQTVSAGYLRQDRERDESIRRVVESIGSIDPPQADGEVVIALFAALRTQKLGADGRQFGPPDLLRSPEASDPTQRAAFLRAFGALDERDQVLLWFASVDGTLPVQLSERLSIRGGDLASTMTHRARSRLSAAYLTERMRSAPLSEACRERTTQILGVADGSLLGDDDGTAHIAGCHDCDGILKELVSLPALLLCEAAGVVDRSTLPPSSNPQSTDQESALIDVDGQEPTIAQSAFAATALHDSTGDIHDEWDDQDAGDHSVHDEPTSHRGALLVVGGVLIVLIFAGVLWAMTGQSKNAPVHAGSSTSVAPPTTTQGRTTSSVLATSTSTDGTTTTSSTSTSTSTPPSTTTHSETTTHPVGPPVTTRPTPPTSAPPATTPPTTPTTPPATTSPPTTSPPSTDPPSTSDP